MAIKYKKFFMIAAWSLYDWASSSFPVIVTTFIFATYFTQHIATNVIVGTYQWASATALAGIIIAVTSPVFGAIADQSGRLKRWLMIFTLLCVVSSGLLWFAYPSPFFVVFTLLWVILGTIGLEIATVFYNSFLPHIAPPHYIGRISGWAWGLGYIGGIAALSLALFLFINDHIAWLNKATMEQVRICGPLTALWYFIFSLPLFFLVPDVPPSSLTIYQAVKAGLKTLVITLKALPKQRNLILFLIAHLFYVDGLNTLFAFGGIYAAGTYGMTFSAVIIFGITMNITAGVGAILLAWVDDYFGSKLTIQISLFCMIAFGMPILFLHSQILFWIFALSLSMFLGPVQSASRSLMAHLVPLEKSTELFGIYAFSGKVTAFLGPWLLGITTLHFNSQRAGMATIIVFFIVGGILINFVKAPRLKQAIPA